ncbi:MAG: MutS-related protein [Flavipsychrobacter sp.]
MTPNAHYRSEAEKETQILNVLQKQVNTFSSLRLLSGIAAIVLLYLAFKNGNNAWWLLFIGCAALFFMIVNRHNRLKEKLRIHGISIQLLQAELAALEGNISSFDAGQEEVDPLHPYTYDLDIFGKGSLFQLICRSVTMEGKGLLVHLFKNPYASIETITERQACIKELASMPQFIQTFKLTGTVHEEGKGDRDKILSWLHMPEKFSNKLLRVVSVVLPVLSAIFILLSIIQQTFHPLLTLVIVANWVTLIIYSKPVKETHLLVGRSVKLVDKYEQLLAAIASQSFQHPKLANMQQVCHTSVAAVTQFRKLVHLFDSRANGMVGPLMNTFFLFDIYCVLKLEKWKRANKEILITAFNHVDETDTFISMANYAFNHPENIYPSFNDALLFEGKILKHPLLHNDSVVGNDIHLSNTQRLYLLSGANMTGKSTYIRTVGITLIMSYTGLPICAQQANIPLLQLFTSMRITDSVQEDVSYFKAELNRMQRIMLETAIGTPYMVLIDEPLRGTNSNDKQKALSPSSKSCLCQIPLA